MLRIIFLIPTVFSLAAYVASAETTVKIHPAFGIDTKSESLLKTIKRPKGIDGTYVVTTDDVTALLRILHQTDMRIKAAVENITNGRTIGYKRLVSTYFISAPDAPQPFQRAFELGALKFTGNKFDVAISSDVGLFAFKDSKGNLVYSRAGALTLNGDGIVQNSNGLELYPQIKLPINTLVEGLLIKETGEVMIPSGDGQPELAGQISLFTFTDLRNLIYQPRCNCFHPAKDAQKPIELKPGLKVAGSLIQGYIEFSNVNLIEEQVEYLDMIRFYNLIYDTLTRLDPSFAGDKKSHKYDPRFIKELLEASK